MADENDDEMKPKGDDAPQQDGDGTGDTPSEDNNTGGGGDAPSDGSNQDGDGTDEDPNQGDGDQGDGDQGDGDQGDANGADAGTDEGSAGATNDEQGAGGGDEPVAGGSGGMSAGAAGSAGAGGDGAGGAGTGGAGGDPAEKSTCELYCDALFGAQCANGPPTLGICVQGCTANIASEPCDKDLRAFVTCQLQFYPDEWECSPNGLSGPKDGLIEANCAQERDASRACLDAQGMPGAGI